QLNRDKPKAKRRKVNQRCAILERGHLAGTPCDNCLSSRNTKHRKQRQHRDTWAKQPLNYSFSDRSWHSIRPIDRKIKRTVVPNWSDESRRLSFVLGESLRARQHILKQRRRSSSRHDDRIRLRPIGRYVFQLGISERTLAQHETHLRIIVWPGFLLHQYEDSF